MPVTPIQRAARPEWNENRPRNAIIRNDNTGDVRDIRNASDHDLAACLERAPLWLRRLAAREWLARHIVPITAVARDVAWWQVLADAKARAMQ